MLTRHPSQTKLVEALVNGGAPFLDRALLHACKVGRACNFNHEETVRWLLNHGANVDALDEQHRTPLDLATASGSEPLIPLLVSAGGSSGKTLAGAAAATAVVRAPAAQPKGPPAKPAAAGTAAAVAPKSKPSSRKASNAGADDAMEDDSAEQAAHAGDEVGNVIHVGSLPSAAGGQLWESIKAVCVGRWLVA